MLVGLGSAGVAHAAVLPGDLDGDGSVTAADEALLAALYGSSATDLSSSYDAAGDLNADGVIGAEDLALFAAGFGSSGGDPDLTPPDVLVTLNDIPDDMNDLLVAPPDAFQITLRFDSVGGSVVDAGSLSVTSSQSIGATPAGSELAAFFQVTPSRAVWEIPAGSDLARSTHTLSVSVGDVAGNVAVEAYGFAVRDFPLGAPFANPQSFFLDFDQDRSLGPGADFVEDLRSYGLSSAAAAATAMPGGGTLEDQMRATAVAEVLARVHPYYGRLPDGSPGADPVDIAFVDSAPGGTHHRLCVGGESSLGPLFLGSASLDVQNAEEDTDECGLSGQRGVFPEALDDLWGGDPDFVAAFGGVDPALGGTAVGDDPLDATVLDPAWTGAGASAAEIQRRVVLDDALDAFAQVVATAVAHETGHMLGLTAPGPAPGGLFGGTSGGTADHNVAVGGGDPAVPWLMNQGASFSFAEMTGRAGLPLPAFRPLGWAYLRDRIVVDASVTGLFPAPQLGSVSPNPAVFPNLWTPVQVTLSGDGFLAAPGPPVVELITEGDPTPNPLLNVQVQDPQTLTGDVHPALVQAALYDVRVVNGDGQEVTLVDGLDVQVAP